MERRDFLQLMGGALGAALLARPLASRAAAQSSLPLTLDPAQWAMLESVCERILPPVNGVSTRAARCVNFIDKLLAHEERAMLARYRDGLAALDACAHSRWGKGFAALAEAEQVTALELLEDGAIEPWPAAAGAPAALFGTLRFHTLLGFLAAPSFGGNHDALGWQAIGFPGHLHGAGGVSDEQVAGTAPMPAPAR